MKKLCLILIGICLSSGLVGQDWEWAYEADGFNGLKTALGNNGSVYVAANFSNKATYRSHDFYSDFLTAVLFLKLDSTGNLVWSRKLESEFVKIIYLNNYKGTIYFAGICSDKVTGDITITSFGKKDVFWGTIDSSGTIQHWIDGGKEDEELTSLDIKHDQIYMCGTFDPGGSLAGYDFASPNKNVFFARYDLQGNNNLVKEIRSPEALDKRYKIRANYSGEIFVHGDWPGPVYVGNGDTIYYEEYFAKLAKFNTLGNLDTTLTATGYGESLTDFDFDHNENLYLLKGTFCGNSCQRGMGIEKFDRQLQLDWKRVFGEGSFYSSEGSIRPQGLRLTNSGLFVIGNASGKVKLQTSVISKEGIYVIKFNFEGGMVSYKNSDGTSAWSLNANLSNTFSQKIIVSGTIEGKHYFGNHEVNPQEMQNKKYIACLNESKQVGKPELIINLKTYHSCAGKLFKINCETRNVSYIQWDLPGHEQDYGIDSIFSTSPIIYYDTAGTYSGRVIIANQLYSDTIYLKDFIKIYYQNKPVLTQEEDRLYCDPGPDSVISFRWYYNGSGINHHHESNSMRLFKPGVYSVKVTYEGRCVGISDGFHYKTGTYVSEMSNENLKLFPNPTNNQITIQSSTSLKEVKLLNAQGKKVIEKHFPPGKNEYTLKLKESSNGIYFLEVKSGKMREVKKIVLK